jgi:hypothetical protein
MSGCSLRMKSGSRRGVISAQGNTGRGVRCHFIGGGGHLSQNDVGPISAGCELLRKAFRRVTQGVHIVENLVSRFETVV